MGPNVYVRKTKSTSDENYDKNNKNNDTNSNNDIMAIVSFKISENIFQFV